MKKVLFVTFVTMLILLFVGSVTAKAPFTPISPDDLKDLKGEWSGERTAQVGGTKKTDLKIYNDSLPLQGEVILELPRGKQQTWQFGNGQIEDGSLHVVWSDGRKMKLGLRKDNGKMELEGDITSAGYTGKVSLKKVK